MRDTLNTKMKKMIYENFDLRCTLKVYNRKYLSWGALYCNHQLTTQQFSGCFTVVFFLLFYIRMHFVATFPLISMLLIFDAVSSQTCQNANWWASLDRKGWSECPKSNTYLKGLWRNDFRYGDERTGRIEMGKCCQASVGSKPLEEPSSCSNADWSTVLKG